MYSIVALHYTRDSNSSALKDRIRLVKGFLVIRASLCVVYHVPVCVGGIKSFIEWFFFSGFNSHEHMLREFSKSLNILEALSAFLGKSSSIWLFSAKDCVQPLVHLRGNIRKIYEKHIWLLFVCLAARFRSDWYLSFPAASRLVEIVLRCSSISESR